jgi:hypothetical protein
MGRGYFASVIRRPTLKAFGDGFSAWLSWTASKESRSGSWMTRDESSSALAQWLRRFPLNEPALFGVVSSEHEFETAARCKCLVDVRWNPQTGDTAPKA